METPLLGQLYKYNGADFSLERNHIPYFAEKFLDLKEEQGFNYWLNFHSIGDVDSIRSLGEKLHIDFFAIQDIHTEKKRPKLEEFPNYIFFSIKSALPTPWANQHLNCEQISFILGKDFLLSFQEKKSDHFTEVRERIEKNKGQLRKKGPDFLLFRMLDAIVDNYFEVVEEIEVQSQKIEKKITRHAKNHYLKIVELQKRKLFELRKIALPMKELASQLEKTQSPMIGSDNNYFFADLKDSCSSVLDEIEMNKQILEGLTNLHYAAQSQKMNEIMKLLTIVSSIFIPLTFIAGIYGMNFEFIPELGIHYGYFYCLGVMAIVAILLIFYFKRRGWLDND